MASGDVVVRPQEVFYPQTSFAPPSVRVSTSTPAANIRLWSFVSTSVTYMDWLCYLQGYGGGGLTFTLIWTSATATTGTNRWGVAIRRWDTAENIFATHTYDFNFINATAPGTSGLPLYTTVAFTAGLDMDSWATNEFALVRIQRDTTVGGNMAGAAQLFSLIGKET